MLVGSAAPVVLASFDWLSCQSTSRLGSSSVLIGGRCLEIAQIAGRYAEITRRF